MKRDHAGKENERISTADGNDAGGTRVKRVKLRLAYGIFSDTLSETAITVLPGVTDGENVVSNGAGDEHDVGQEGHPGLSTPKAARITLVRDSVGLALC